MKANNGTRKMQDHDCTCYQELTITHLEVSSSDVSELSSSVPSMSKKKLILHIKPTLQIFLSPINQLLHARFNQEHATPLYSCHGVHRPI